MNYPNDPTTRPGQTPPPPGYSPQGPYPQYPQPGYPPPGYPQMTPQMPPPTKKKGKGWLIALGIVAGVVVLCGVIGAIASNSNTNKGTKATDTTTTTSNNTTDKPPAAVSQHFKPDELVKVGEVWEITVSNIRTNTGGEYSLLKPGNVYVLIDVNFKNITNEEKSLFGNADWNLKDTQGQKYDAGYTSDASPPDGKIEPGGPAKGTLVYEVPATTKEFRLAYEQNMWLSGQTIWDLTVA